MMINRVAIIAAGAAALLGAGFAAGRIIGAAELEKEKSAHVAYVAKIEAENSARLADAADRAKRIEREKERALADLLEARRRSAALDRANRDLVVRLRDNAAAYGAGISAGDGPCRAVERRLAESLELHAEGAGLLAEAVQLVGELGADRDAARKINESIKKELQ